MYFNPQQPYTFESWVTGGTSITATAFLNTGNAPRNTTVTLTSSNTAAASVPSSITIPKGVQSQNFTISTSSVTTAANVTITAAAGGTVSTIGLIVLPANGVTLAWVAPYDKNVSSGSSADIVVGLTGPAPAGDATVTLTGSRANIVDIPSTIVVPAGSTQASVFATTHAFTGVDRRTTITATYAGMTQSTTVTNTWRNADCSDLVVTAQPQVSLARPEPVQCAGLSVAPCLMAIPVAPNTTGDTTGYYLYTPELQLLAETVISTNATKPIAYSYLWFGGIPVASIEAATNTTRWYFTDHLGTPLLQTDTTAAAVWRAEQAPYGSIFSYRAGATLHQPLRFPGQIALDTGDVSYNIFRWYRSQWGRYTQADPIGLRGGIALYAYADDDPIGESDPLGLFAQLLCRQVTVNGLTGVKKAVVNGYKPVHCRLRVKCGCGGPDSFDTTVGRENVNPQGSPGIYALTKDPFSPSGYPSPTWSSYPVDGTGTNCEFEKCVQKAFQAQQNTSGLVPPYNALGPNSNTFVHNLITQCGGNAAQPPKAYGW